MYKRLKHVSDFFVTLCYTVTNSCCTTSTSSSWLVGCCIFKPPFGDLGATYDDHLRLIRKRVVDFLLVLIELFSLGVTAEAIGAKIDRKSAILLQQGVGWLCRV